MKNSQILYTYYNNLECMMGPQIKALICAHTHYQTKFIINSTIISSYLRFCDNPVDDVNTIEL